MAQCPCGAYSFEAICESIQKEIDDMANKIKLLEIYNSLDDYKAVAHHIHYGEKKYEYVAVNPKTDEYIRIKGIIDNGKEIIESIQLQEWKADWFDANN